MITTSSLRSTRASVTAEPTRTAVRIQRIAVGRVVDTALHKNTSAVAAAPALSSVTAKETAKPFCDKTGSVARPHSLLHEFSALDPALIEGMSGAERRPIADACWHEADPQARHGSGSGSGSGSETFVEFDARVTGFLGELLGSPSETVLFGHGVWFGMLWSKLLGFSAEGSGGMRAFRRFQPWLPMPDCAVCTLEQLAPGKWRVREEEAIGRRLAQRLCLLPLPDATPMP